MTEELPPNSKFQELVIAALRDLGGTAKRWDIINRGIELGRFTPAQLAVPPPPRNKGGFENRIQFEFSFALTHLKSAGRITNPSRGVWTLLPEPGGGSGRAGTTRSRPGEKKSRLTKRNAPRAASSGTGSSWNAPTLQTGGELGVFRRFRARIAGLPARGDLRASYLLRKFELRQSKAGRLVVAYAPFDHLNTAARVVIVGITPGANQMEKAFASARRSLAADMSDEAVLARVKRDASFEGSMRERLVGWLDGASLPEALGLDSSVDLFGEAGSKLVHTTSMVRYPAFLDGRNFDGHSVKPLAEFRDLIDGMFAPELASLEDALVIPLGSAVERVILNYLAPLGVVDASRVLAGFPHPSGGVPFAHGEGKYRRNRDSFKRLIGRFL